MSRNLSKIFDDDQDIHDAIIGAIKLLQEAVGKSLREHSINTLSTNELSALFSSIYAAFAVAAIEWVGTRTADDESDAVFLKKELTKTFMKGFMLLGKKKGLVPDIGFRFVNADAFAPGNN